MTDPARAPAVSVPRGGGSPRPPERPSLSSSSGGRTHSYNAMFAVELRRALEVRDVTQLALAEAVGVRPRQVWHWNTARSVPYLENAAKIADALDWPRIVEIVRAARTVACRTCGRRLVSEASNSTRRYCDEQCRRVGIKAGRQGHVHDARDTKIDLLSASVDAMCRACEPGGVCSDGACPLRLVSPLPLRIGVALTERAEDGRKSRWDNPTARGRAAEQMRLEWDKNSTRRARLQEWNRNAWAALTPEQRLERGRRISEGIRRGKAA